MYLVTYFAVSAILFLSCGRQSSEKVLLKSESPTTDTIPVIKATGQNNAFFNRIYLTQSDAEKILGEKAALIDSSSKVKGDTLEFQSAYTANLKDTKTGKTGSLYFMIEKYGDEIAAKNAYNAIRVANEKHEGVKIIRGVGDEAYFHSDGQNFYFTLVRKGTVMFRLKVNKITSHTSLDQFNLVSKKISESL